MGPPTFSKARGWGAKRFLKRADGVRNVFGWARQPPKIPPKNRAMGAKRLRDGCADGCDASATRKNHIFKQVIIIINLLILFRGM
jgi:hypothetical protein